MPLSFETAVARLVELATDEDLGAGDLTTGLMPDVHVPATFDLILREPGVLAGERVADLVLRAYDERLTLTWHCASPDGMRFLNAPARLAVLHGPLGSILAVERVLLNFLQRLSGIATCTRAYVDAVEGTSARILDTRKTAPGWRLLEKYAVRCGGGTNHRAGLYDAVLLKDNHLCGVPPQRVAAAVFQWLNALPPAGSSKRPFVEVEAERFEQVEPLCAVVGIDAILLDNFSLQDLRSAVELRDRLGLAGKVLLEASGGITLQSVRDVALTGVERISVGAITHSARGLDLSLERR